MAWKPGESGNPHRGPNKDKRIKAALVRYADADPSVLDKLAARIWTLALKGDVQFVKELADRLDGKVAQESNITVTRVTANQLGDDELADIAAGRGEGADPSSVNPSQLN